MSKPEAIVGELEQAVQSFRDRLAPDAVDLHVGGALEALRARFLVGNESIVAPDAVDRIEAATRRDYDERLREDARVLEQRLADEGRALADVITTLGQLADPMALEAETPASDQVHEAKKLRILMELDRSERRLAGRSPTEVLALYTAARDGDVLKFVIEDAARRGDLKFAPAADPTALSALQKAIEKTQRARVAAGAPELVAAEKKLTRLRKSATLASLFDHLRRGRGIAMRPSPRPIRIVR